MTDAQRTPLERFLAAMAHAGLDVTVDGVRDAFWLALQPRLLDLGTREHPQPQPREDPDTSSVPQADPAAGGQPFRPTDPAAPNQQEPRLPPPQGTATEEKTKLYGAAAGGDEKDTVPASPLRVLAGSALPRKLPLSRSLRPLGKWFRNPQYMLLDEEATASATAEARGAILPILEPQRERWYELAIVADAEGSMDVWHETLTEFEQLTRTSGVFRDVRRLRLRWRTPQTAVLENPGGATLLAASVAGANARRLVFLMTNGTGVHWSDGRMAQLLRLWSGHCSVAIIQMLPERMWRRGRLGEPTVRLRTLTPGFRMNGSNIVCCLVLRNSWPAA